jgi:hypothetical protein
MKNNIRQMIKNVVEENAVSFKEQTGKVLYTKVGQRLQEQYKTVAKTILGKKEQE